MDLYEKNGNALYILNVLKKYTDEDHVISAVQIAEKIKEDYKVTIDQRTVRRIINLLKYKDELQYDISTREENGQGYYINKNPDTDFEPGEIRAIIDSFSYGNYFTKSISNEIINKCKNLQNIYENEKIKDYKIYSNDTKTDNMEVIKNIEDIQNAISQNKKIQFEYWKYSIERKLEKKVVSKPKVSPYAIVYSNQQFYFIGIKEGEQIFYHYRLDRIKNLKITDEKISIKKTEREIKNFAESSIEVFGGEKVEIEADCDIILLDTIFDTFGKNITIIKLDENHFKLKVDCSILGFQMWAMRNIDMVEVIKPLSLREKMKQIVKEAGKKYDNIM